MLSIPYPKERQLDRDALPQEGIILETFLQLATLPHPNPLEKVGGERGGRRPGITALLLPLSVKLEKQGDSELLLESETCQRSDTTFCIYDEADLQGRGEAAARQEALRPTLFSWVKGHPRRDPGMSHVTDTKPKAGSLVRSGSGESWCAEVQKRSSQGWISHRKTRCGGEAPL